MGEVNITFNKQSELVNHFEFKDKKVAIIGCGCLGSFFAEGLARIGFGQNDCGEIVLIDYDTVEPGNLSNQYYFKRNVNDNKVDALKENLEEFDCCNVKAINKKIISEDISTLKDLDVDIIVIAVDDNDSRKDIMENIIPNVMRCEAVIEGGMSLRGVRVSYYGMYDWDTTLKNWINSWRPSSEQTTSVCGTTQTSYPTVMNAVSKMMGRFVQHYNGAWSEQKEDEAIPVLKNITIDYDCYTFRGIIERGGITTKM